VDGHCGRVPLTRRVSAQQFWGCDTSLASTLVEARTVESTNHGNIGAADCPSYGVYRTTSLHQCSSNTPKQTVNFFSG
jgi:hypothetical protein